jgi:hypothetical protein
MPNLIGISRKIDNILRQFVMRVGENEDRCHVERSRDISCRFRPDNSRTKDTTFTKVSISNIRRDPLRPLCEALTSHRVI